MLTWMAVGLLWVTGCTTPTPSASTAPEPERSSNATLRVGVATGLPPMIYKQDREFRGVEADFARALAQHLQRPLRFVELGWEDLIPSLFRGKIDIIMSGMSITPARQLRVSFSQPYLRLGQVALVRRNEMAKYEVGLLNTNGRVGVQKGTTGEQFAQQYLTRAAIVTFSTAEKGADSLAKREIDVFIHDAPINWWLASTHEADGLAVINTLLTDEYFAWAVSKNDTQLLAEVNQFIEKNHTGGQLQAIVRKWLPNL